MATSSSAKRPSRVHFNAANGEVATEYITEEPAADDMTETEYGVANSKEEDDYLANCEENYSDSGSDEDDTTPNDDICASSHIFSSQNSPLLAGTVFKLDERQKMLFSAVEENDLEKVRYLMCGELPAPDVNSINQQRRSPLIVAIRAKHLDMIMLLLQCGAAVGDALLHAVETGSPAIVRLICTFLEPSKKALKTTLDGFALDTSFLPAATPLMYAAKENNHEMVKILVEYGAELPNLDAVLSRTVEKTSYEFSMTRLFWHQAISSEAYLLYATDDPVQAAFNAGRIIKKCEGNQLPHLKEGYKQLMKKLDEFITRYLELARNSDEISTLLCEEEPRAVPKKERQSTLPQRVLDALDLKYKQVIAHPNCMHFVLDQWYHANWQDLTMVCFLLWTTIIALAQPIFCLFYIVLPFRFSRSMKTPYVRFLMHWASRIYFIFFLLFSAVAEPPIVMRYNSECERLRNHASKFPDPVMCFIYSWIIGLTWREMKEVWTQGVRAYFKDIFNIIDCLQVALYWVSITTNIISSLSIWDNLTECAKNNEPTSPAALATYRPDGWNSSEIYLRNVEMQVDLPYRALVLSEAAFAIATVLTFMSSLRDIVVLGFVGPLRVSLGGMISDIFRFVFLFAFVWLSFGIGMTHLYRTHDAINQISCDSGKECEAPKFASFMESMEILFWSLFDLTDLEEFDVTVPGFETVGEVAVYLYGAYMTIAAVVMLNALIAMMSNTYTRVEENSEIEWRVARTKLMAEYMTKSATLPPPFNLVPTFKTLEKLVLTPYYCVHGEARRRKHMEKKAQAQSRGRRQGKYKLFMHELTERYIMCMEMEDDEDHTQKLRDEITSLHESLLAMRNEIHDIRTENTELCDTVNNLCQLLRHSTSSVAVQTHFPEDGVLGGKSEGTLLNSQLSITSTGKKKTKGFGKKFSKFVSMK